VAAISQYVAGALRSARDLLKQPRLLGWLALAISAAVLLPCLGRSGFWEPNEIKVADSASRWLEREARGGETAERGAEVEADESEPDQAQAVRARGEADPAISAEPGTAEPAAQPGASSTAKKARRKRPASADAEGREPAFNERLVAFSIERLGYAEGGARAPFALLGLVAVMAVFFIGARVAGRRAGFIAAMVMLSFPLLVLQSRQLTSEIAVVTGSALLVLGLTGLCLPNALSLTGRRIALVACDAAAIALGGLLTLEAGGPLLGLVPPLVGFGLGVLLWTLLDGRRGPVRPPRPVIAIAGLSLIAGLAALAWFAYDTFTIAPAAEGEASFLGRTLRVSREIVPGMGDTWKAKGDVETPFSALFEQLGFGMFPWVALAPLAVIRLAVGRAHEPDGAAASPAPWAGYALFAWTALAWLIATIALRKVGPVQYPAIAAVALAIGLWLDDLLAARASDTAASDGDEGPGAYPLLALFGLFAVVVVARDLHSMPEELISLTAEGMKAPEGMRLQRWITPLAAVFGVALAAGLFLWRGPYGLRWRGGRDLVAPLGRWGLHAAVAIGVLFALFLAHVWIPGLAGRMSSRDLLEVYRERRQEGDRLGILGNLGTGPSYYAGTDYEKLGGRQDLLAFLSRPTRVFALTRASELCPLHKESVKKGFRYHVLDDRNTQFLLVSNQLRAGEADQNPLNRAIRRTPPDNIKKKLSANFDDQIELIGVNMPRSVARGKKFRMTLFYKVLEPVKRPWKIFVHLNAPSAPHNITGDHAPIRGRCSTTYFQPGDYIVDTFEVKAGDMSYPKTTYQVFTGFFVGGSGNFTNMKALSGKPDKLDRVPIGSIQVR
jgi:4-amino-4-deoxy-L-arabinose transferase-like glycosyltransferase